MKSKKTEKSLPKPNEQTLLEYFKEQKKNKDLYNQIDSAKGIWEVISLYLTDKDYQVPSLVVVDDSVYLSWDRPNFVVSIEIDKKSLKWHTIVNEQYREGNEVRYSDVKYMANLINEFINNNDIVIE